MKESPVFTNVIQHGRQGADGSFMKPEARQLQTTVELNWPLWKMLTNNSFIANLLVVGKNPIHGNFVQQCIAKSNPSNSTGNSLCSTNVYIMKELPKSTRQESELFLQSVISSHETWCGVCPQACAITLESQCAKQGPTSGYAPWRVWQCGVIRA
eukprot:117233-Amphidinium_carterae.1